MPGRILIISFSYRPMANPRSYRWTLLAEQLAATGEDVDVVTTRVAGAPDVEQAGRVTIHRVGHGLIESMRSRLRGGRERAGTARADAPAGIVAGVVARMRAALLRGALRIWRALHWPDASCLWFGPALAAVRRLARHNAYDIIISVAPAFTAVRVGEHALRLCPRARWLLDLGDPFSLMEQSPPNNASLYDRLNRRSEERWLGLASAVSVTNENVRRLYAEAFPSCERKLVVIPPLLSLPAATGTSERLAAPGRRALVYVGTLYRGLREPGFLLELLVRARSAGQLTDVDLHFFGDVSACEDMLSRYRSALGDSLEVHGLVGRERISSVMQGADALVNIGNDSLTQLPSKVVEYAATGRPVLNIARTAQDTSVAFFAAYPGALNLVHEGRPPADGDVAALCDFLSGPTREAEPALVERFVAPYLPSAVTRRYLDVIAGLRGTT